MLKVPYDLISKWTNKQIQNPAYQTNKQKPKQAHPLNSVVAFKFSIVYKKDLMASALLPSVACKENQLRATSPVFTHLPSALPFRITFFPFFSH